MAKKHKASPRKSARMPKAPPMPMGGGAAMPGPNEFDAGQEQAMRQGQRQANMPAPPDGDDMGGLGGM